jgi:hypothetical protein
VAKYLAQGEPEKVLTWTDQRTGLACKSRVDWLAPGIVLDLKTARDAVDPRAFSSAAWRLGYLHQLAFYCAGARTVTGVEHEAVVVAVEPEPPYDLAVYNVDGDDLWLAGEEVNALLAKLAECRKADQWPGAFTTEQTLHAPRWAHADAEDMEVAEEPAWMRGIA